MQPDDTEPDNRGFPDPAEFPDYDQRDSSQVEADELGDEVPDPPEDGR